jgi:hypothetical protein
MPPWIAMFCKNRDFAKQIAISGECFCKNRDLLQKSREASRRRPPTPTHTGS